jgi:hypothetical protein
MMERDCKGNEKKIIIHSIVRQRVVNRSTDDNAIWREEDVIVNGINTNVRAESERGSQI